MIQDNEIITLMVGFAAAVFIHVNMRRVKRMPFYSWILASFYTILAGWILTVLEGFFLNNILNLLEHICYALSAFFIIVWCFKLSSWVDLEEVE